ncbi:Pre-rRNA-processing protein esf1 [Neonectria ditissima]|uniref:Pre-rRNA-processing protein esf1 n=1 Tax=Neonectria ditissima TaxID=78410 RepID=A0A0N8H583_9HYPO|nr:Pre-rRNA-processing protein esf1 [Neonectria ditissima]
MKNSKKKGGSASAPISDARFASFESDPRYRLPSKKAAKTTIDKRFSRMLKDDEFTATAKVDRYGRKLKSDTKKKALQRLYQEEGEDDDEDKDEDEGDEEDIEVDADEVVQRELLAAHASQDPARGGGFASSESDSDSDDDSESGQVESEIPVGDMQRFQDEQADAEVGEVTKRVAVVNLDWDHVKSTDLMALFSSFLPTSGGRIEKVSIFPSEFGKERMQQEEVEGPPKALFKTVARSESGDDSEDDSDDKSDSDSQNEDDKIKKDLLQEGDDQDFDSDALRSYQLDRLRYYYAVMVCSSPEVAQQIYEATDGREYQASSNFLDLRFVPDDVTFDDEPRDECDKTPDSYKPIDFVTNALQSSKVKLTWDMHPDEYSRKESINRAFSGSRAQVEENDLRAYLASDSEDEPSAGEAEDNEAGEDAPKLTKKELARQKMRAALGLGDEPLAKTSKSAPVGDMQITFTPALSEGAAKKDETEETTIEKYVRKEKERKEKKRQMARAKRDGKGSDDSDAEVEDAEDIEDLGDLDEVASGAEGDDLGFDDPFFTAAEPVAASKASVRKEERRKKREAREAAEAETAAEKEQLAKVMAADANDNQAEHLDHFDMNEILRAQKRAGKKGKAKKRAEAKAKESRGGLQEDFAMDVGDDRFKAVFDSHEYAIDPSNPKFKATEGMKKLLEEGRKKRRAGDEEAEAPRVKKAKKGRR